MRIFFLFFWLQSFGSNQSSNEGVQESEDLNSLEAHKFYPWSLEVGGLKEKSHDLEFFIFPRYQNFYKKWRFGFKFEVFYKDEKFETFEDYKEASRFFEFIEYLDKPKKHLFIGKFQETLGYGVLVNNYSQEAEWNHFYPGTFIFYNKRDFDFNLLASNITKPEIFGGRIQYNSNKFYDSTLAFEHFTDFNAPLTVSKGKSNEQRIHLWSLDYTLSELFLSPYLTYGKIKTRGDGLALGLIDRAKMWGLEVENRLEARYEDENFLRGYFDRYYEIFKIDYFGEFDNRTKIEYLNSLVPEKKVYGYFASNKVEKKDVFDLGVSFEDRQGENHRLLRLSGKIHSFVNFHYSFYKYFLKSSQSLLLMDYGLSYQWHELGLFLTYAQDFKLITDYYLKKNSLILASIKVDL